MLAPAAGLLDNIRSGIASIFPEADSELENIGGLLTEIVTSTNQSSANQLNVGTASAETEKILEEAELAAEQKIKQQFLRLTPQFTWAKRYA